MSARRLSGAAQLPPPLRDAAPRCQAVRRDAASRRDRCSSGIESRWRTGKVRIFQPSVSFGSGLFFGIPILASFFARPVQGL